MHSNQTDLDYTDYHRYTFRQTLPPPTFPQLSLQLTPLSLLIMVAGGYAGYQLDRSQNYFILQFGIITSLIILLSFLVALTILIITHLILTGRGLRHTRYAIHKNGITVNGHLNPYSSFNPSRLIPLIQSPPDSLTLKLPKRSGHLTLTFPNPETQEKALRSLKHYLEDNTQ